MTTLHSCEPHFVRCLVPNTHKKPGEVEPHLVMDRLRLLPPLTTRLLPMLSWTRLDLTVRDTGWDTLLSSSELELLLVLRRLVMTWSSNGSDSSREKFSREPELVCTRRREIREN